LVDGGGTGGLLTDEVADVGIGFEGDAEGGSSGWGRGCEEVLGEEVGEDGGSGTGKFELAKGRTKRPVGG